MRLTLCGVRTFEQGTLTDRQRRKRGESMLCYDVWRAGFEVALNTPFHLCLPPFAVFGVRSRCRGGLREGCGERSAVAVPAS